MSAFNHRGGMLVSDISPVIHRVAMRRRRSSVLSPPLGASMSRGISPAAKGRIVSIPSSLRYSPLSYVKNCSHVSVDILVLVVVSRMTVCSWIMRYAISRRKAKACLIRCEV